ncbi:IS21 family transposase [Pullulanibacillus sp. KACC 23026]|uniref:IS21 family transposase n=1 Tax=Pullulanibacillus sp. KACC 23026 TaxID=3028315 RepID=UPI0023B09813|nr:IS21 family transposase [Pullulanibacillus sp. KACC 23026]WEG14500.1 IS21 family transposase [Pullulanibacillus sp. KACC 23026]
MEKWKVYMEIYQLKQQGFKVRRIARKLGISRTTVYKYLELSPEEMSAWMASTKTRYKKLDPYEMLIQTWLSEHADLSASQIHDWLREKYPDLKVGESTVRGYVKELREKYGIPKVEEKRAYEAIPDPPMGKQAQVDFGQTIQKTLEGKEIRLYFISFVMSHSRFKYAEWLDRPFTTKDVIRTHENAFRFYGGIPHELVYDQDSLMVVSENSGDLILTGEFQAYREERKLVLHVCRKADPESKGRIENVVGFIKKNFAKNRVFGGIDQWNEQCIAWLERTGNGKVHNTTKKRPVEVFALEKQHLRLVTKEIVLSNVDSSITRTVRKDNTILYLSNRYSVPLGTYKKDKDVFIEVSDENHLLVREEKKGPVIADHIISQEKGGLIQDRQHKRDRTKGIPAYITSVSKQFEDAELAYEFLTEVQRRYPRYIRDQLQLISKVLKSDSEFASEALKACLDRGLYSATEFSDIHQYVKRQRQVDRSPGEQKKDPIKPLEAADQSILSTKPKIRDMNDYLAVLQGGLTN